MGLGILALILAVPLGIGANLLTPAVRNQLSRLSSSWTARRIRSIEKQLKRLDERDFVIEIFRLFRGALFILFCISAGLAIKEGAEIASLTMPGWLEPVASPETLRLLAMCFFSGGVFGASYSSTGLLLLIQPELQRPHLEKSLTSLLAKQDKRLN